MFKNREQAGKLLAKKVLEVLAQLPDYQADHTIVVGLPRGGVPVAKEIACALEAELTIRVSKKIGAPFQPELALGAVSSSGIVVLNEQLRYITERLEQYIESERKRLTEVTRELEVQWLEKAGIKHRLSLNGKLVVLVDDGVATGMTTLAAIRSLKREGASAVMLATPVISPNTSRWLQQDCDLVVALLTPHDFGAIGEFYQDFHQVDDDEMIETLSQFASMAKAGASSKS